MSETSNHIVEDQRTAMESTCYHCNDRLPHQPVELDDKAFCCHGCAAVYEILEQNGLCAYYQMDDGRKSERIDFDSDRFAYLDLPEIQDKLIRYKDDEQVRVLFYIPRIHCSSCIYLLEHMHEIHPGFLNTSLNFPKKELTVIYDPSALSLREVVEWLSRIGYEPYLSLEDMDNEKKSKPRRDTIIKLAVAGFAFGNIMLLSFPEYLGADNAEAHDLDRWFRYIALLLSIPVVFYSAGSFFHSAWASMRQGLLNIDFPIALAVAVTFGRSVYEVVVHGAPGYFDSMTGIVFFMLIGRFLQDKTYDSLKFERDYKSYFPLAVPVFDGTSFQPKSLNDIVKNDLIRVGNEELVPADGVLVKGTAYLDYSFVTGESDIVEKQAGETIYAGARLVGERVEVQLLRPVSQSYLTSLWNKDIFSEEKERRDQWLDNISHFFTWLVILVAIFTGVYWTIYDTSMVLNTVTAVLIIACPCTILLTSSFTNGFVLNIFSKLGFFIKSAGFLEVLSGPDAIVLDKTGTITDPRDHVVTFDGAVLTTDQKAAIKALTERSAHPMSQIISRHIDEDTSEITVTDFKELHGRGVQGQVLGMTIKVGSSAMVGLVKDTRPISDRSGSRVHICIDGQIAGTYFIKQRYRQGVRQMFADIQQYAETWIISGDIDHEKATLEEMTASRTNMLFNQLPEQKLDLIKSLQEDNKKAIMIGDGLNDSGALRQSDFGIAVANSVHSFTPASDAILRADLLPQLHRFVAFTRRSRTIIAFCLGYSLIYNILGIYFAFNGVLTPLLAAIIMPASSLSIILISWILIQINRRIIFN